MKCFFPFMVIDAVIEFWNNVPERASLMAERNATIHTPCRLPVKGFLIDGMIDFFVVIQPILRRTTGRHLPFIFDKSFFLSHLRLMILFVPKLFFSTLLCIPQG